jgi:putative pyruvate formate lyase activating enzyme
VAAYRELYRSGELERRAARAREVLKDCSLCPQQCRADRLSGETGKCRTASDALVSSHGPHFGEEAPLVGSKGSGTIFFANCNLCCVFCQNYHISQLGQGEVVTNNEIVRMMLSLQEMGCHNINLVTPTHVVPQILDALNIASGLGLSLPVVYNCGGYESVETLRLLDGVVDIYMPDMKYSDEGNGFKYSGARDYSQMNRMAVKEMHRQVGDLQIDERGVATRGLLVRHLVLPAGIAGTEGVVRFLAEEISSNTYLNVMSQYRPSHRAHDFGELSRSLTQEEFIEAVRIARRYGMERLDGVRARSLPL